MSYIISLDVGTSSMRAVLYDTEGKLHYSCGREYHTSFPLPSYVEQEPATWAEAAAGTLSEVGAYLSANSLKAEAVAVTSQRASLIPMDRDGVPLRNAIMWQDKRTIGICEELSREYGLHSLYRRTGLRINPLFVLNKIIWLRRSEPELFRRAHKLIGVQDFVVYTLTGRYATDWTQGSRTMLMDLARFKWDDELLRIAEIGEDRLCDLLPPGSAAGGLTAELASRCGLPQGLPVIVCGGDQQNAAIALGVIRQGCAEANTGTGSFVLSYSPHPAFDAECRVLCQAGAVAGSWMTETAIFNTGAIYRWFKERFCREYLDVPEPYTLMDAEAAAVPPGSGGVLMLPHFEGSAAPYWNPRAKGVFFNLGLGSTRGMLMRAILEGISLEIAENLGLMRSLIGEIGSVSVAGGMSKSALFCGIQAAACRARVVRHPNSEASSLGAAVNAAVALGVYSDVESAFSAMVSQEAVVFEPDEETAAVYDRVMRRKQALYEALKSGEVYELFMGEV